MVIITKKKSQVPNLTQLSQRARRDERNGVRTEKLRLLKNYEAKMRETKRSTKPNLSLMPPKHGPEAP